MSQQQGQARARQVSLELQPPACGEVRDSQWLVVQSCSLRAPGGHVDDGGLFAHGMDFPGSHYFFDTGRVS